MNCDLAGKSVLVTGAATGIGLATVRAFAQAGAKVILNYLPGDPRGQAALGALCKEGHNVEATPADITDSEQVECMMHDALTRLGGLDYLVNNAGTAGAPAPIAFSELDRLDEEVWTNILSTNLVGPFRCTRFAADALRSAHGAIVNVASVSAFGRRGSSIAYAASKAGLVNLTSNLAKALAPDVRVNAVAPGLVNSEWIAKWPRERLHWTAQNSLLGRLCEPSDIAEVILFLCAGTRMVNAQTIVVDGGSIDYPINQDTRTLARQ